MKFNNKKYFLAISATTAVILVIGLAACSQVATPASSPSSTQPSGQGPAASGREGSANRPGASGTLAAINGNMLSITNGQNQTTAVTVNSSTNIQQTVNGSISDLVQGQSVIVIGIKDASGNIAATLISIRPANQPNQSNPPSGAPGFGGNRPRGMGTDGQGPQPGPDGGGTQQGPGNGQQFAAGTIASITLDSMTLNTPQGTVNISLGSATLIQKTVSATVSDLKVGEFLAIGGSADSNGNFIATTIMVRQQGQGGQRGG